MAQAHNDWFLVLNRGGQPTHAVIVQTRPPSPIWVGSIGAMFSCSLAFVAYQLIANGAVNILALGLFVFLCVYFVCLVHKYFFFASHHTIAAVPSTPTHARRISGDARKRLFAYFKYSDGADASATAAAAAARAAAAAAAELESGRTDAASSASAAANPSPRARYHGHEQEWTTDESCVICFEEYTEGDELCALPCKHIFHSSCVHQWLDGPNHTTCPFCKYELFDLLTEDERGTMAPPPEEVLQPPSPAAAAQSFGDGGAADAGLAQVDVEMQQLPEPQPLPVNEVR